MKLIVPALILSALLAGCSSKPAGGAAAATADPFVQKLQSLPENERAEYARTHMAEAAASAGAHPGGAPGGQ